jgi:hypothetical protein
LIVSVEKTLTDPINISLLVYKEGKMLLIHGSCALPLSKQKSKVSCDILQVSMAQGQEVKIKKRKRCQICLFDFIKKIRNING